MCSRPEPGPKPRRYQIGEFLIEILSPPFPESDRLRIFRTECPQPPVRRVTVRGVTEVAAPDGAPLRPTGVTDWIDPQGRLNRFCPDTSETRLLYRTVEESPEAVSVDFALNRLDGLSSHLILRWLDLPRVFLNQDAVFLHASFIEYAGKAILFTAPKQTGKSTQARLWEQFRGAEPINGDRALLCRRDGLWRAYGSPFCGSSNLCKNRTLEIAAIVILRQGPENVIAKATAKQALLSFLEGVTYDVHDRKAMEQVMNLSQKIAEETPFYHFACLPEESAVACLHERLQQDGRL